MIVVTGAAGFIGSAVVSLLNQRGSQNVVAVDALNKTEKWQNLRHLALNDYLDKSKLFDFLASEQNISAVVHMGACSATTETDANYLMENNYRYTKTLAELCLQKNIRFIYASSAATYGNGDRGYDDQESPDYLRSLKPLNMYGFSKHLFDMKAQQMGWFQHMVGLKFFNVYGPNEYFKGDMSSVVFKAYGQILETGKVKLFKSHRPDFKDGEQLRDFVYVKDVVAVIAQLIDNPDVNGLFNLGSGTARSFKDLALATFEAMGRPANIEYIDMPLHLQEKYQYYTCARMDKLNRHGLTGEAHSLETGIHDYVKSHLAQDFAPF